MAAAAHPFRPSDISLPGYAPQILPVEMLLGVFFSATFLVIGGMWLLSGFYKYLNTTERILCCWWIATGLIHLVLEGKEYAKADSRYATRDAFTIQMEAVTAFIEGPACFLIVYGILLHKPWRFTLMLLVSCGQLYGDVLYFLTCVHEGFTKHSRPEPLYFWFYFVFLNSIWLVVPSMVILYASKHVNAAVAGAAQKKQL